MKNFVISIFIFLLWAILGMWWYYSCPMCVTEPGELNINNVISKTINIDKKEGGNSITVNTSNQKDGLNISNAIGADVFNFNNDFQIFNSQDSTNIVHIPRSLLAFKDSIFSYLNTHQDKELLITGWYKDGEWKTTESDNFGLNRAKYMKSLLSKFGVNSDKINVSSSKEAFNYKQGVFKGGLKFMFNDLSETKVQQINLGTTNKTLYTNFNSREFKADNTLQAYTIELKNYLINNPSNNATITGHSDSVGEANVNEIIARDRATNVMKYFIQQGIDANKLKSFSKGETTPISTNDTNEGRALNRRIEIKVN